MLRPRILSGGLLALAGIYISSLALIQKQPPEVFCKKRCSQKFRKIHRETSVPESLFQSSCWHLFCRTPPVAASVNYMQLFTVIVSQTSRKFRCSNFGKAKMRKLQSV